MTSSEQVFKIILEAYDLAASKAEAHIEARQRSIDIFNLVTEFNRQYQERLAISRERRRLAKEKRLQREAAIRESLEKEIALRQAAKKETVRKRPVRKRQG